MLAGYRKWPVLSTSDRVDLGYEIGETTVKNILLENGYDP